MTEPTQHADTERPLCDGCGTEDALFATQILDSVSMDNLFQGCAPCTWTVIADWFDGDESDVAGWEIRKLQIDG